MVVVVGGHVFRWPCEENVEIVRGNKLIMDNKAENWHRWVNEQYKAWPKCQSRISFDDSSKVLGFIAVTNIETWRKVLPQEARKKRSCLLILAILWKNQVLSPHFTALVISSRTPIQLLPELRTRQWEICHDNLVLIRICMLSQTNQPQMLALTHYVLL